MAEWRREASSSIRRWPRDIDKLLARRWLASLLYGREPRQRVIRERILIAQRRDATISADMSLRLERSMAPISADTSSHFQRASDNRKRASLAKMWLGAHALAISFIISIARPSIATSKCRRNAPGFRNLIDAKCSAMPASSTKSPLIYARRDI